MSKIISQEALDFFRERDNFLILCHVKPDGDTLGSGFALRDALRALGKKAQAVCGDEITPKYVFLSDGEAVPKPDFEPKTIVTVDVASVSLLGEEYGRYAEDIDLAIDHHPSFQFFGKINICDPEAAATGEIIYKLIDALGVEISPAMNKALFTSITTDTGCFRYSNTSAYTMRMAADLMELGLVANPLIHHLFMTRSKRRIVFEGRLVETARMYKGGKVAFGIVTKALVEEMGLTADDLEDCATILRCVEGVELAFLIKEHDDFLRISCRSNAFVNVSELAAKFGGGGHTRAAAMRMDCSIEEAIEKITAEVDKYLKICE